MLDDKKSESFTTTVCPGIYHKNPCRMQTSTPLLQLPAPVRGKLGRCMRCWRNWRVWP